MTPSVSCVVCTYRRPQLLLDAVRSVIDQTLPTSKFEVIVVNNAADEPSAEAISGLGAGNVRSVKEPAVGLARARNRGIEEAQGELVAFMDDDAVADPGWLDALLAAWKRNGKEPAVVGGRILPAWAAPPPPWLRGHLLSFLSLIDYGDAPRACRIPVEPLYGCNMAVPRETLEAVGGFSTSLGRKGRGLLSDDDLDLQVRVLASGGDVLYEPAAVVRHRIPRERMTRRWFLRRVFAQGVTDAIVRRSTRGGPTAALRPPLIFRIKRVLDAASPTLTALAVAYAGGLAAGSVSTVRTRA